MCVENFLSTKKCNIIQSRIGWWWNVCCRRKLFHKFIWKLLSPKNTNIIRQREEIIWYLKTHTEPFSVQRRQQLNKLWLVGCGGRWGESETEGNCLSSHNFSNTTNLSLCFFYPALTQVKWVGKKIKMKI